MAKQNCEYCDKPGHDYTVHPEAVSDVKAYQRTQNDEETWSPRSPRGGRSEQFDHGIMFPQDGASIQERNRKGDEAHRAKLTARGWNMDEYDDMAARERSISRSD